MTHIFSCPGAMRIKDPVPEFFNCTKCGAEVEIWSNENFRRCETCGSLMQREQVPTCIDWCKYGKECVGEEAYNKYMEAKKGKGEDAREQKEEEERLKELMDKVIEKCQRRSELNGEKTDN